ncbi:unnamed protein product [Blepharisma stoltei]|uniref:Uncharacterized protein n=1 Tax=Blepharisma stoltei TaxID=1481888 RepID=A0AAU9JW27_9CILI|nr:unnamed protein product [Blepharisma stoltei]
MGSCSSKNKIVNKQAIITTKNNPSSAAHESQDSAGNKNPEFGKGKSSISVSENLEKKKGTDTETSLPYLKNDTKLIASVRSPDNFEYASKNYELRRFELNVQITINLLIQKVTNGIGNYKAYTSNIRILIGIARLSDYVIKLGQCIYICPDFPEKENYAIFPTNDCYDEPYQLAEVKEGINFLVQCCNERCKAYERLVVCSLGFGTFYYSDSVESLKCPYCKKFIDKVESVGFYKCFWVLTKRDAFSGKISDVEEQLAWNQTLVENFEEIGQMDLNYLVIKVRKIPDYEVYLFKSDDISEN